MTTGADKSFLRPTLRRMVPDRLLKERDIFLRLGPQAGPIYARLRLLDVMGMRIQNNRKALPSARSVLFICFGNIMRSPMAEAMMRQSLADAGLAKTLAITSAGLHATPGKEAHPWALAVSEEIGLSLCQHRAKLITSEMVENTDVIFAMDFQNKAELLARFPEAAHKIVMLSAYAQGPARGHEIGDPFLGDMETTRSCYSVLQTCIGNLVAELSQDRRR